MSDEQKPPMFLEGNRIVDADGNTIRELPPEGREMALKLARQRALMDRQGPLAPQTLAVMEYVRQKMESLTPEELAALQEGAAERVAEIRRKAAAGAEQSRAELDRLRAEIEREIPDDTTARWPLN